MLKNLGTSDRIVRLVIAAALLVLLLTDLINGTWAVVSLIVAAILILTSLINFCPLYFALGLRTNKQK